MTKNWSSSVLDIPEARTRYATCYFFYDDHLSLLICVEINSVTVGQEQKERSKVLPSKDTVLQVTYSVPR